MFKIIAILVLGMGFSVGGWAAKPDPDMKAVLDQMNLQHALPVETLSPQEARRQPTPADAVRALISNKQIKIKAPDLAVVRDIDVKGAVGTLKARMYSPKGKSPLPMVVYFHGGGFVLATNETYDATPRSLAQQTGAIFISVEYRKAPESKFPAAHEDAFAAYKWVVQNAAALGGDPARVAVAGESAGGNLALNVAIRARDEGFRAPVAALLIYPVASNDMNTSSYQEFGSAQPLNKSMMEWFIKQYLNDPSEAADPRINLVAANLKDLPPTTIITAQIDPLLVDGERLAGKLKEAGVKVSYREYEGVTHEFFGMASVVDDAQDAQKFAATMLKDAFD